MKHVISFIGENDMVMYDCAKSSGVETGDIDTDTKCFVAYMEYYINDLYKITNKLYIPTGAGTSSFMQGGEGDAPTTNDW